MIQETSIGPDDACRLLRAAERGGSKGIRASSPAGETGMSEPDDADLPVARDGTGQLSKDALRAPAPRYGFSYFAYIYKESNPMLAL